MVRFTLFVGGLLLLPPFMLQSAERTRSALTDFMVQQGYEVLPLEFRQPNRLGFRARLHSHVLDGFVDTGATDTWLDPEHARKLPRLRETLGPVHSLFGQAQVNVERVAIARIELDGQFFTNMLARVLELPENRETHTGSWISSSPGPTMPGLLLGLDFLSQYHALVNCRAPCVYIQRGPAPQTDKIEQSLSGNGLVVVPLKKDGSFMISALVNDCPALFILDTGAEFTILDWNQLAQLKLKQRQTVGEAADLARQKQELQFTQVSSLKLGAFELKNLRVGVVSLKRTNADRALHGLDPIQGLLGFEVLHQGCALIDCPGEKLFLAPTPRP